MDREDHGNGMDGEPVHTSLASPLTAVTISAALGDRRQIQMAINLSLADPADVRNAMLDDAMKTVDRQAARYDLKKLEDEFEEAARHLRNFLNGIPMAEKEAKYRAAAKKVEIAAMREARDAINKDGYDAHVAKGRRGDYVPGGAVLSRLNGADAEIAKAEEMLAAIPADTEQNRAKAMETVYRYQEDLRKRRVAINDLRHVAGLPAYAEFEGIENEAPAGAEG